MKCPRCQQDNSSDADFCRKCGAPVTGGPSYAELQRALTESLDRQTATGEILRVISSSPTDIQPVLDALVKSAARFCGADDAVIHRLEGDGLPVAAHYGPILAPIGFVTPAVRGTTAGRCVLERRAVHVADYQVETEEFAEGSATAREFGVRTILSVPLLREGVPLGAIILRRTEVQPFSDKQIALLQTFADQAVIAIENVRLSKELEAKNHDLTEALDQQMATSEILRVISSSPTDVQPVLQAVAENAARLCDAAFDVVNRFDGDFVTLGASYHVAPEELEVLNTSVYPSRRPTRETASGRALIDRATVHIHDIRSDPEYTPAMRFMRDARSARSLSAGVSQASSARDRSSCCARSPIRR